MKKLILVDGMAAVYRGYYAMNRNPRVNSKGFNTSASLGFATALYDLIRTQSPTHIGVAFDLSAPTFRHEMYADYKAGREAMPEEIQQNLPWITKILAAFNIPTLTCEGFEADDVIGTLSHQAEASGFDHILMVTPDKDFAQLVTERVHMYRYGRGGNPDTIMGIGEVKERFGVDNPHQVIDLLGLWGDASDNIPGVPGVGEKTAKKLISQFGSIEEMISHADEIKNDKIRQSVIENANQALFSKQLATIRLDAPITLDEQQLAIKKPDYGELRSIFDILEFRQLARRIFTDLSLADPSEAMRWKTGDAKPVKQATPDGGLSLFDPPDESLPVAPAATEPMELIPLTPQALADLKGKDIAVHFHGPRVCIATSADKVYSTTVDSLDVALFTALLADSTTQKLCHDLKQLIYTIRELSADLLPATHYPLSTTRFFDIQLAHYLVDPEMRHSLDSICSWALGSVPDDAPQMAAALWQIYPRLAASLHDAGLEQLYTDVELPLVEVLVDMESAGVRIDTEALTDYSRSLASERSALEAEIYRQAGHPFNIASPRQLGQVLYEELKVTDKPPRTATKQYSTAEDVLGRLAGAHPVIPLILEHRSLSKLIGTYLEAFPKLISPVDHRLHTEYNQTVTATGRLSSSNPNLQNIPIRTDRGREIRRAFSPADADHLILAADYSQIELRIIASLSRDSHMLNAFASGQDIHAATAARIFHTDIASVSPQQRRHAKSVNFGIVYGISAFGLSQQLDIPRREAAQLIDEYFAQYPDILAFIESSKEKARAAGYATTLLGRRRYLPDINSRNATARSFAERNAVNMPIQGTSADMIKIAMVRIHRRLKDNSLRTKMILQVHDELVFDLYRPEEAIVRDIVLTEMQNALPLQGLPVEVSIGVGSNWLEAH